MITPSQRNPFETFIVAAFGIYCVIGLFFFDEVATSTIRGFPIPYGMVFLLVAALSCIVVLTGIIMAQHAEGVLIERAGLFGLTGLTATYAMWAFAFQGSRGTAFGVMMLSIAFSSAWRALQISRARRLARKTVGGE